MGRATITRQGYDRASVVARTIVSMVAQCSDESELYAQIVTCLREEFTDIERQVANDLRID
jgi:hypothetical protein